MLVLSRKRNERLFIDVPPSQVTRRIAVTVVEIIHGKARLGIDADEEVSIVREEVTPKQPPAAA